MRGFAILALLATAEVCSAADFAINCGGPAKTIAGRAYAADHPYEPGGGSGFVGGRAVIHPLPLPIGGTDGGPLLLYERAGTRFGYRFDVPDGDYVVTLSLAEHDRFAAGLRRFSARIEGTMVASDLDPWAVAGKQYAIELRRLAHVTDGRLDVDLEASEGEAMLGAIIVRPAAPAGGAPPPPHGVAAHRGYDAVILRWSRDGGADLAGYLVDREDPSGLFRRLTPSPTPLARFIDASASRSRSVRYRVSAVDVRGAKGAAAEILAPPALAPESSPLPRVAITLDPVELRTFASGSFRNVRAHGTVDLGTGPIPAGVRHRGATTRYFGKPSLKLALSGPAGAVRHRINLKAEPGNPSLLTETLAAGLFRVAGVPAPSVTPVHLRLNGRYAGLYFDAEQVDRSFLETHDLDPKTALFKAVGYTLHRPATFSATRVAMEPHTGGSDDQIRVWRMLAELEETNEGDFDDWLEGRWDRDEVLSFLAVTALISNGFDSSSYYVAWEPARARFLLVPWDLNNLAFGQTTVDAPPITDLPVLRNAMQAFGPGYARWNLLFTRVLLAPRARRALADRIEETAAIMDGPAYRSVIAALHARLAQDATADVLKYGWEDPTPFQNGLSRVQQYVTDRVTWLGPELAKVRDPLGEVVVSEFEVANLSGARDELGEVEPWIELANRGSLPVDLGGLYLTNDAWDRRRFRIPTGTLLPAGGRLVVWADGEPGEGRLHAGFRLGPDGGAIVLSDDQRTLDAAFYGAQMDDVAYGRLPDDTWAFLSQPTPGQANSGSRHPRRPILEVTHVPEFPGPGQDVFVTARIDRVALGQATTWTTDADGARAHPMFDDGLHGDGAAGDGIFGARLPGAAAATTVRYDVRATYVSGSPAELRSPLSAPASSHTYTVHSGVPPRIFINELVARNDGGATDESGEHPDWVELWSDEPAPFDLSGMFLSDSPRKPFKWQIPEGTIIGSGDRLVFWLDGDIEGGPRHASFRLKSKGDELLLTHRIEDGAIAVDETSFGPLAVDGAWARCPDGGSFTDRIPPTPGKPNGGCPRQGR